MAEAVARGLSVFVILDVYEIMLSQSRLEQLDGIPVFRLTGMAPNPSFAWKRLTDVVLVAVFAVSAIPLLLLRAWPSSWSPRKDRYSSARSAWAKAEGCFSF